MISGHSSRNTGTMEFLFVLKGGVLCRAATALWLACSSAYAQEALMNSLPKAAPTAPSLQEQSTDYTYKNGDFRLLVTPALDLQWLDNVNLSSTTQQDDFVVR